MNLSKLREEIRDDPLQRDYSAKTNKEVAVSLMTEDRPYVYSRRVTWRDALADLGPTVGASIKNKLTDSASPGSVLSLSLSMLGEYGDGGGLDVGHENTRAIIDSLVTDGILTSDEGTSLKGMAEGTRSRAAELGLGKVRTGDVKRARRGL